MLNGFLSRIVILCSGTLYPAYYSFKTVRAKSVDDYLVWMMYWIVFALFSVAETFSDVFLCWLPFYYELKVLLILWLLPTIGNGSPIIYRKCLHPFLKKNELKIDLMLTQCKDRGQDMLFHYVSTAAVYVGKTCMDVIQKNVPFGFINLMLNNGQVAHDRSVQQGVSIPHLEIYEMEEPMLPESSNRRRRTASKSRNKRTEEFVEISTNSRSRGRKNRQSKHVDVEVETMDLDINLNESF